MKKVVDRIKKKPRHVRDQYAFYGAFIITGIIAAVWLVSVPAALDRNPADQEATAANTPVFSTLFNQAKEQYKVARDTVSSFKEQSAEPEPIEIEITTSAPASDMEVNLIENAIDASRDADGRPVEPEPERIVQIATSSATSSPEEN